jgi:putative transposase
MARPEIRQAMQEIAAVRRRFGYRRIGLLLERRGMLMNPKKLYRLYHEEGLSVSRRRGRKRTRGTRTPMPLALMPNRRWSLDFVADTLGASRKFRILAVIDDCRRENLCLIADTSISGERVAREMDGLVRVYGKPACIVSDRRGLENDPGIVFPRRGTEFTSGAILKRADQNGVAWHCIDPGKPQHRAMRPPLVRGPWRGPSSSHSTAACVTNR